MQKMFFTILISLLLCGCSHLHPYRVTIQQGNVIDQKAISQLHNGMSKTEVQALLGTPVLQDIFASDSWTYAYTKQVNGGKIEQKKLIINFDHDKVVNFKI